jgi:hypothetical protein
MILSAIGLSFNFIGTILVAFSIKKGEVEAWKSDSKKREYLTAHNQKMFRWGIGLLAFGFLVQLSGQICPLRFDKVWIS